MRTATLLSLVGQLVGTDAHADKVGTDSQLQILLERTAELVAMEFSGSVRRALESRGWVALSADLRRECEVGGMHYQGDVRDIVHLSQWRLAASLPRSVRSERSAHE